uniref:Replication factor A C-terminal domain-containing protein n=1 Tax=Oryza glaberrima TaxID=4538 RepID=I1R1Z7_ORYGL
MAPSNLITALTPKNDRWRIKVKVIRLWDAVNPTMVDEFYGIQMIVLDAEGNSIHVSISKQLANHFRPKIKINSIYTFKNFKVMEHDKYRVLKNNLKILFYHDTIVKETCLYLDVIGLLSGMKPIEQRMLGKNTSRERVCNMREIELLLLEGEKVKITLWGDILANMVDDDLLGKQTVFIATGLLVKEYEKLLSFGVTSSTEVFLDMEIPASMEILSRHNAEKVLPTMIEVDASTQGTIEEQMFYNRKTLKEITELRYSNIQQKEFICTVKAKIEEIKSRNWWYMSCDKCFCGTRKESNVYICNSCGKEAVNPKPRYVINLEISDHTTRTTCTIFNEEAERIFGHKSVSTMLEEQNGQIDMIPDTIRQICGRILIFRFKLTKRNLEECKEDYKVNYTFTPNEKLEMNYVNDKAEEFGQHNFQVKEERKNESSDDYEKNNHRKTKKERSNMRSTKRSKKEPYITDSDGKTNEKAITIDDDSEESLDDYFDEEYNKKVTQESTKTNPSKRRVTRRFKIANKSMLKCNDDYGFTDLQKSEDEFGQHNFQVKEEPKNESSDDYEMNNHRKTKKERSDMRSTKRSNKEPYITDFDGKTNEKAITIDDDCEESLDDYFDEEYNEKVTQESTKTNPSKRRVTRRFKTSNKAKKGKCSEMKTQRNKEPYTTDCEKIANDKPISLDDDFDEEYNKNMVRGKGCGKKSTNMGTCTKSAIENTIQDDEVHDGKIASGTAKRPSRKFIISDSEDEHSSNTKVTGDSTSCNSSKEDINKGRCNYNIENIKVDMNEQSSRCRSTRIRRPPTRYSY